jgi:hypothetical protein
MPVGSNWLGDDHPTRASHRDEGLIGHIQATAQAAADRGWYWRPSPGSGLVPDTRRCICHGDVIFDAMTLTTAEAAIRHPLSNESLGIH